MHPTFAPDQSVRFTVVADGPAVELELAAEVAGEPLGPVTVLVPIPPVRDDAAAPPFRFLNPRS